MKQSPQEDPVREHSYDGIQEFDKKLPNWWLFTLYATIVFAVAYWIYYFKADLGPTQEEAFDLAMADISARAAEAAAKAGVIDDAALWAMAKDADAVAAGEQVYISTCLACHGANLEGGIGLALNDGDWKYGGDPLQIKRIVVEGLPTAGMPPWGPVLGDEKVNQVVAYILDKQEN